MKLLNVQFLEPEVTSPLLGPNVVLSTQLNNMSVLSLCVCECKKVSHPC
jgi:hypothetical protein